MERFNARTRLKTRHRNDCPKMSLRSYARSLALTPRHERETLPPSRLMLIQAAEDWLHNKGVNAIKAAA